MVQVDRANFQLRNALWGVALGLYQTGTGDSNNEAGDAARRPMAPPHWDMGWGAVALSGPHTGAGVSPSDTLKQCVTGAEALIRAVARGPVNSDGAGARSGDGTENSADEGDPVHGLVGRCLSLLLLLRSFEERTAALASTGKVLDASARAEWDAAFAAASAALGQDGTAADDSTVRALHAEIASNLSTVRERISPT